VTDADIAAAARHAVDVWQAWRNHHATPPGGLAAAMTQLADAIERRDDETDDET
jgi:hypothetical protein